MDDYEGDSPQEMMRKIESRGKSRTDLSLIALRQMYAAMEEHERAQLKSWIDDVLVIQSKMPFNQFRISLHVILSDPLQEIEPVRVAILAYKNAFECWDRGDDYAPNSIREWRG